MIKIIRGEEAKPGVFAYRSACGRAFGKSRQPLLDACRQLKRTGADPGNVVGLFREGRAQPDLICTVGYGSGLTVSEVDKGTIRFAKFRPFAFREAAGELGAGNEYADTPS